MKNTLLAVLIMALCYDPTQAQSTPLPTPGYIKYQGQHPNQSIDKGSVTTNALADGVATTDKLANDIITSNKMADGTVSSNKLAEDIINSLNEMEEAHTANKQTQRLISMSTPLYNAMVSDQNAYARHMQHLLLYDQLLQKPRPTNNRKGWLPL
ncbi:MAG TPA: hypothetical protein VF008_20690 [Niastella sp.]